MRVKPLRSLSGRVQKANTAARDTAICLRGFDRAAERPAISFPGVRKGAPEIAAGGIDLRRQAVFGFYARMAALAGHVSALRTHSASAIGGDSQRGDSVCFAVQ